MKSLKEKLEKMTQNYQIKEWRKLLFIHESAVEEINTKLKIINKEFKIIHDYNPIEHIKDRVKKPESIIEKMERKNIKITVDNAKEYIHDIAGIRVICSFTNDIYKIYKLIEKQTDIKVLKVKDYIKNPKPNGYRSLHMIVELPIFLTNKIERVKIEIQIRTIAMDFWASLEHKIYYKYKGDTPNEIPDQLKDCAEIISDLDKRMLNIREELINEEEINEEK